MSNELSDKVRIGDRISRSEDLMFSQLGDEIVIMSIEKGRYFALDDVAARIWTLMEQPIIVHDLCEGLLAAYDVKADECVADTLELLQRLNHHGLIRVVESGPLSDPGESDSPAVSS
jgi:hypothetical protein